MATRRVLGRAGGGRPGHDHALPPGSSHGPRLLLMHWRVPERMSPGLPWSGMTAATRQRRLGSTAMWWAREGAGRALVFFSSSFLLLRFLFFSVYRFRSSCISSSFLIFFSFSSPFSSFHPFPVRAEFWSSFSHSFSSPSVLPTLLS